MSQNDLFATNIRLSWRRKGGRKEGGGRIEDQAAESRVLGGVEEELLWHL